MRIVKPALAGLVLLPLGVDAFWRSRLLEGRGKMTELRFRGVRVRMFSLTGAIALAAGCGSNGSTPADGGDAAPPSCVDHDGLLICQPTGFPFVTIAGATSDACAR